MEKNFKQIKIGNTSIYIDPSHMLPTYYSNFKFYDRVLPKLAKYVKEADEYLKFIDIGANIGDTLKLVDSEVKGKFLCVEGDNEFLELLNKNVETIKESSVTIVNSYCSDSDQTSKNISVQSKDGTAKLIYSDEADSNVETKTLDTIINENKDFSNANVLKIDTDGFEINILKGAKKFITTSKPVIHTEFTPDFYTSINQNPLELISILVEYGYRSSIFYDNFGKVVEMVNLKDSEAINKLISRIDKKEIYYYDILTIHKDTQKRYEHLFNNLLIENLNIFTSNEIENTKQISELKKRNDEIDRKLEEKKNKIDSLKEVLKKQDEEIQKFTVELVNTRLNLSEQSLKNTLLTGELEQIKSSKSWILISKLNTLSKILFPVGSLRRDLVVKFVTGTYGLINKFKSGLSNLKNSIKTKLVSFKSDNQRKKIIYIGHEYHLKSKSTEFLIELLGKTYGVTTAIYKEDEVLNLVNGDTQYYAIIFFQKMPNPEIYKKINCSIKVLFPMYDEHHDIGFEYWNQYKDLKIINFSKVIHEKLVKWGFNSMYIQYFSPKLPFSGGNTNKVYFWQRITDININTLSKLLTGDNIEVHLHRAVDPGQKYIKPSKTLQKKYSITFSDWFETREQMQDVSSKCGIYMAPRKIEGIGLSFIEALTMGKAVIAPNVPTMNEYIKDGENGYLYDLDNLVELDLHNIDIVQKNAYKFMEKGIKKWDKDKSKIITFINS